MEPPSTDLAGFPSRFHPLHQQNSEESRSTSASGGRFYFSLLAPGQHSGLAVKEPLPCVSPRVLFLFLCSAPPLVSITQSSSPAQTFHSQSLQSLAQSQLIFFCFDFLFQKGTSEVLQALVLNLFFGGEYRKQPFI